MILWISIALSIIVPPILAVLGVVYFQPRAAMRHVAQMFPRVVWSFETSEKVVALTIDDAPTKHTAVILDILKQYNVRATFFVIGSYATSTRATNMRNIAAVVAPANGACVAPKCLEQDTAILHRMLAEGHEIGNHTWTNRGSVFMSAKSFEKSFVDTHNYLTSVIGTSHTLLDAA